MLKMTRLFPHFFKFYAIYVFDRLYYDHEYRITIYIYNVGGAFGTLSCGRDGAFRHI